MNMRLLKLPLACLILFMVAASTRLAHAFVDLQLVSCTLTVDSCASGGPGHLNGSIEPGEEGSFVITVANAGDQPATMVVANAGSATPGVVLTVDTVALPDLLPGQTFTTTIPFEFTVATSVPCGTSLDFAMTLISAEGNFRQNCSLTVPAPCTVCLAAAPLRLQQCSPVDDCAAGGPGDSNGIVEPGETALVRLIVANDGAVTATNVRAVVTTSTPGVIVTQPNVTFADIPAGGQMLGNAPAEISVDATVACGTDIVLTVEILSDQGDRTDVCLLPIPAGCTPCTTLPVLEVQRCAATDNCAVGGAGDGNFNVDPGETADVSVSIINRGGSDATNVVVTMTTATPGVTITNGSANYGTIAAGASATPALPHAISVALSVPCGTIIVLDVTITSDQGTSTDSCALVVPAACIACTNSPILTLSQCLTTDDCSAGGPGDGDGSLDPGETAFVRLVLDNGGGGTATGIVVTVSTSTPGVTITQPTVPFPDIPAGGSSAGNVAAEILVGSLVPCGTSIVLDLSIQTDQGTTTETCTRLVPVACQPCATAPPILRLASCVPADTCAVGGAGDADGNVDPGETASVTLSVENTGAGDATNVTATVTTATPGVTINQGSTSFGTVAAGLTVTGTLTIDITVALSVPCGASIVLDVAISSDQGAVADGCTLLIPVPCVPCTLGGPILGLDPCSAVDSCAAGGAGDGDGNVDPGETADVTLTIRNTGTASATTVTATVTTATPGVVVTQGSANFGTITAGSAVAGSVPIAISVGQAVPCGTNIVLDVAISSDQGPAAGNCQIAVPAPCTTCTSGVTVSEVPYLITRCAGGIFRVEWQPATGADTYGIHVGTIAVFAGAAPDYDHGCVASGLGAPLVSPVAGSTCGDGEDVYLFVVGIGPAPGLQEGPLGFADRDGDGTGETAIGTGAPPCP